MSNMLAFIIAQDRTDRKWIEGEKLQSSWTKSMRTATDVDVEPRRVTFQLQQGRNGKEEAAMVQPFSGMYVVNANPVYFK